ncbi:MAG TPA: peptidoglycan editing factor PgeF [Steroidobacteraceae bacterium]|nr:peptidoglycan editing factor PgeF [Steroidobacteraceae bacterium]
MNPPLAPDPMWLLPDWRGAPADVRALSTRRAGGVSRGAYASLNLAQHVGDDPAAVDANRAILRRSAGLPSEPLWLSQVHGVDVVRHTGAMPSVPPRVDAAVAFARHRVCVVMTADCLPVVLVDRAGTRIGVAHAGWRGLAGGVLEATVAALRCAPSDLVAWLGPAIAQPAFEVGLEVRDAFVEKDPAHATAFVPNAAGRLQADLYELARQTLARTGVTCISGGGRCTSAEPDEFYSFRRDGGRTGRMATLAWLA